MNRHLVHGIIVGAVFALPVTWIAASDAIAAGDSLTIFSTTIFGLAAGLCVGALIAANFAMLAFEDEENQHTAAHRVIEAEVLP